jgi:arabinose-5-phosphate isomerase
LKLILDPHATQKEDNLNKKDIDIKSLATKLLAQEIGALQELSYQLDYAALEAALELILNTSGNILVIGAGTSSSIARRLAHVLTCSGGRAVFLDPGQAQHGYSQLISAGDLMIAFSRGGETAEVNHALQVASQRGARIIGIMEFAPSTMSSYCDVILLGQVSPENDACGVIPLASTIVHAAIGDVLCAGLLEARGLPDQEFGKFHPGGAVGLRLADAEHTATLPISDLASTGTASLSAIRGLILDMDGVLWHGDRWKVSCLSSICLTKRASATSWRPTIRPNNLRASQRKPMPSASRSIQKISSARSWLPDIICRSIFPRARVYTSLVSRR